MSKNMRDTLIKTNHALLYRKWVRPYLILSLWAM